MRIIRGENKGKRIKPPKSFKARPTTDFAKEALFAVLENNYNFENIRVLDLFSGTGSISYELASRGCKTVTAVEINYKNAEYIRKTAKEIFPDERPITVVQTDVFRFLKNAILDYDVIFADPPYELENIAEIPDIIFDNKSLHTDVWVIVEHSRNTDYTQHKYYQRTRKYGKVLFSFFEIPKESNEIENNSSEVATAEIESENN